jgi:hypothetical protein
VSTWDVVIGPHQTQGRVVLTLDDEASARAVAAALDATRPHWFQAENQRVFCIRSDRAGAVAEEATEWAFAEVQVEVQTEPDSLDDFEFPGEEDEAEDEAEE